MSGREGTQSPGARVQRARFAVLSATILLASAVSLVSVVRIGDSSRARMDVTATGEHRISPRTERVLDALPSGTRILLAIDRRSLEPGARVMLSDVLDTLARATDRLETDWIDTGSDSGRERFESAIGAMVRTQGPAIEGYRSVIARGALALGAACAEMESRLAPSLDQIAGLLPESSPGRVAFQERAALLRVLARDGAAAATTLTGATEDTSVLPAFDGAWRAASPVAQNIDAQLDALARELNEYARSTDGIPASRDAARCLASVASQSRAPLARAADDVRSHPIPSVMRAARAIEAGRAALAVGPGSAGVVAIDLDGLVAAAAAPAAEARARVESILGTALGTLLNPDPPIVVLVHAENPAILARAGLYEQMTRHLAARAIDLVMWPLIATQEPPSLREINPEGRRPVVYVLLSTDSAAQGRGSGVLPGIERAQLLGRVSASLFERGERLLISVSPSIIPATGAADPTVEFLRAIGVECDTARPLVRERLSTAGRTVTTPIAAVGEGGDHAIAGAIRGLPLFMAWPLRISVSDSGVGAGVELWPLLTHPIAQPGEACWGESQWLSLWQGALENQAAIAAPPTLDARDHAFPEGETRVMLACAIERASPRGSGTQRIVVVGTHSYGQYGWLADPITHDQRVVDGRPVRTHPGNLELLDASIAYLAGLDTLIAQSPEAGDSPTIRALDAKTLRNLRLAIAFGVPGLVLVVGAWAMVIRRRG